jgi:hypothetical protein
MTKSEHSYYLMKGEPKDNDSRVFTPAMYDKINTLADKPIEIVMTMKAQEAQHQQEVDLEIIKLLALGKTQRQSEKWNSQMTRQSRKSMRAAVRVRVVIQRMRRSIAARIGGIFRNATAAIRWGTLQGIVQAPHQGRALHRH